MQRRNRNKESLNSLFQCCRPLLWREFGRQRVSISIINWESSKPPFAPCFCMAARRQHRVENQLIHNDVLSSTTGIEMVRSCPKWRHPRQGWASTSYQRSASTTTRMDGTRSAPTRRRTSRYIRPEHGTAKSSKPPLTYLKQIGSLLTNNPGHLTAEKIAKLANDRK